MPIPIPLNPLGVSSLRGPFGDLLSRIRSVAPGADIVQYVSNTGQQYFKTGIKISKDDASWSLEMQANPNQTSCQWFGAYVPSSYWYLSFTGSNQVRWYCDAANVVVTQNFTNAPVCCEINENGQTRRIRAKSSTATTWSNWSSTTSGGTHTYDSSIYYEVWLGCYHNNGMSPSGAGRCRIFCARHDIAGVVDRNYVPISVNGEPKLYDISNNNVTSPTGTFTVGDNVTAENWETSLTPMQKQLWGLA